MHTTLSASSTVRFTRFMRGCSWLPRPTPWPTNSRGNLSKWRLMWAYPRSKISPPVTPGRSHSPSSTCTSFSRAQISFCRSPARPMK
jgi:hypothetical protein